MKKLSSVKRRFIVMCFTVTAVMVPVLSFADTSGSAVTSAIQSAGTDLIADAGPIIVAAIGVGLVFWGAKLLWTKFKSMAK